MPLELSSRSGTASMPGPGKGGVLAGEVDGERDAPRRWGWEVDAVGEVMNGSRDGDEEASRNIWSSVGRMDGGRQAEDGMTCVRHGWIGDGGPT